MKHFLRLFFVGAIGAAIITSGFYSRASAASTGGEFVLDTERTESWNKAIANSFPESLPALPRKIDQRRQGLELTAESAVVVDAKSGRVLFEKQSKAPRPLASITKLMTALVLLDLNLDWNGRVTLLEADRDAYGKYYLSPGDEVNRADLFKLSLGASANNATAALVRTSGLSMSDFVARMNQKARDLKIEATFVEPVGINPGNFSTAAGVSMLLRAAMQEPKIREATTQAEIRIKLPTTTYTAVSTDDLLVSFLNRKPYSIMGGKTGFIDEAGYCLALSVRFEGHDLDIVVLGTPEPWKRFEEAKALAVWAFQVFSWEL
ncbi:MAG: serine hydrolase [bacterium]